MHTILFSKKYEIQINLFCNTCLRVFSENMKLNVCHNLSLPEDTCCDNIHIFSNTCCDNIHVFSNTCHYLKIYVLMYFLFVTTCLLGEKIWCTLIFKYVLVTTCHYLKIRVYHVEKRCAKWVIIFWKNEIGAQKEWWHSENTCIQFQKIRCAKWRANCVRSLLFWAIIFICWATNQLRLTLRCVVVYCSVWQYVAAWYSVLQCIAVCLFFPKKRSFTSFDDPVWVMCHMWMSHVAHMNESCCTYEWVMMHTWMGHVAYMSESCCMDEYVMSHIWISHVTRIHELCRT